MTNTGSEAICMPLAVHMSVLVNYFTPKTYMYVSNAPCTCSTSICGCGLLMSPATRHSGLPECGNGGG